MIREGFEPSTHSLEGCCSIQLSYRTMLLYRERDSNPQAEALVPKTSVSTNFTISVFFILYVKERYVSFRVPPTGIEPVRTLLSEGF